MLQWPVADLGGGPRNEPPWPKIFIFMHFWDKLVKIVGWRPPLGLVPHSEILDVPLVTLCRTILRWRSEPFFTICLGHSQLVWCFSWIPIFLPTASEGWEKVKFSVCSCQGWGVETGIPARSRWGRGVPHPGPDGGYPKVPARLSQGRYPPDQVRMGGTPRYLLPLAKVGTPTCWPR